MQLLLSKHISERLKTKNPSRFFNELQPLTLPPLNPSANMSPPTLPAMKTNPKFIFFTDFDGTITLRDSNDFLTDNLGYGEKLRKQGNQDVLHNRITFRDSFHEMLETVKTPFDQCIKILLENIKLDPYFAEFYRWARANNVPVVVLSSGMVPIIRALLVHLVGETAEDIQIVSNDVASRDGMDINSEGGWRIVFHDERYVNSR